MALVGHGRVHVARAGARRRARRAHRSLLVRRRAVRDGDRPAGVRGRDAGAMFDAILNRTPVDPTLLNPVLPPRLQTSSPEHSRRTGRCDTRTRLICAPTCSASHAISSRGVVPIGGGRASPARRATDGCSRRSGSRSWRLRLARCGTAGCPGVARQSTRSPCCRSPTSMAALTPSTFSDGITESLIRDLSQVQSLKVTARSRVFRYRGKDMDPRAIGCGLERPCRPVRPIAATRRHRRRADGADGRG